MANKQLNNKVKREIEYTLMTYIERRLRVSCDLLLDALKGHEISIDEYVNKIQEVNKILDNLNKDDTRSKEKYEYEESVNLRRVNLINQVSHQVVPTEDNIKEILELVKYYLDNYYLPNNESLNETLFLRFVMRKLKHDKSHIIRKKAFKYFVYFSCNKDSCFSESVSGRISFGYGSIVLITNQDDKVIFKVDEDKKVGVTYCPFDDFILYNDSLFLARFDDTLIPLREVDGYYHDFLDTGKIYQTNDPTRDDYIEIIKSLSEYLEESGLTRFNHRVFSIQEIEILNNLINNTSKNSNNVRMVAKKNNGN